MIVMNSMTSTLKTIMFVTLSAYPRPPSIITTRTVIGGGSCSTESDSAGSKPREIWTPRHRSLPSVKTSITAESADSDPLMNSLLEYEPSDQFGSMVPCVIALQKVAPIAPEP